jgi:2-amino-4-hydroxy-6-hydroxymethyldihydropteridine diphosphokinase
MARIYLLLGGNIGDREEYLGMAKEKIALLIGNLREVSSIFETQPWGFDDEVPFLNQLIIADTLLEPEQAMQVLLKIENRLGRVRDEKKFLSRTIDIDILFYDDRVICKNDLVVPHPQLHNRRFALEPLAELVPGLVHPVFNKTIEHLLKECTDKMAVRKI